MVSHNAELRKKLNQLECAEPEEDINEQLPSEVEVDIENQDEAYINDLLVAAGLYDGLYNRSLSKWNPMGKPISNHVFQEVEDSYRTTKVDEICSKYQKLNHKMIIDLLTSKHIWATHKPVEIYGKGFWLCT